MTGNSPRILILTHCFPANRSDIPGNFLYDLCVELKKAGARTEVITQKMDCEYDKEYLGKCGAGLNYFKWGGGRERFSENKRFSLPALLKHISLIRQGRKKFRRVVKDFKPHIVLNCWAVPAGIWSYFQKPEGCISAVWALGSDISVYGRKRIFKIIIQKVLFHQDVLFTNSIYLRKRISEFFNLPSEMLFTSRNLPQTDQKYEQLPVLKLLFVGRLEKIKGPDILIDALIMSGIDDFTVKIIGDGVMKQELIQTVHSNGLEGRIEFLGMKDAGEISYHMKTSDYLVISSRNESMPVVFWEAMQISTPVLATDTGDISYYCDKFNVGRICRVDPGSLAELLQFVSGLRQLRKVLSENTSKLSELSSIASSADTIIRLAEKL